MKRFIIKLKWFLFGRDYCQYCGFAKESHSDNSLEFDIDFYPCGNFESEHPND